MHLFEKITYYSVIECSRVLDIYYFRLVSGPFIFYFNIDMNISPLASSPRRAGQQRESMQREYHEG